MFWHCYLSMLTTWHIMHLISNYIFNMFLQQHFYLHCFEEIWLISCQDLTLNTSFVTVSSNFSCGLTSGFKEMTINVNTYFIAWRKFWNIVAAARHAWLTFSMIRSTNCRLSWLVITCNTTQYLVQSRSNNPLSETMRFLADRNKSWRPSGQVLLFSGGD